MSTKRSKLREQPQSYSDHPVVKKKIAEARAFLEKADLSFLDTPPKKQS